MTELSEEKIDFFKMSKTKRKQWQEDARLRERMWCETRAAGIGSEDEREEKEKEYSTSVRRKKRSINSAEPICKETRRDSLLI